MKQMLANIVDNENGCTVTGDLTVEGNVKYQQTVIPACPTTAGTYVLKLTVTSTGTKSFTWVAA
jgi:hypothetical protein